MTATFTTARVRRTVGGVIGAGALAAGALSMGSIGYGAASASPQTHTIHFTDIAMKDVTFSNKDIEAGKVVQHGTTVGYDISRCTINVHTHKADCDVAVARKTGMIFGHVVLSLQKSGKGHGTVTGGTGAYSGATGSIATQSGSNQKVTQVTLVVHS